MVQLIGESIRFLPRGLCSVGGIAVDGGADGDVCRFTGGLAGHAGVWTGGEAAGREGCRQERESAISPDRSGQSSVLGVIGEKGATPLFPFYMDRVKQH